VTDFGVDGSLGIYFAFGLRLRSDIPLPELPVAVRNGAPPDVEIRLLDVSTQHTATTATGVADVADDIAMLWWDDVGRFVVSDGSDICVASARNVDPAVLRSYLLGPVLTALLHQRGWIVLKAGAAVVGGRIIAFVPGEAADKLAANGHQILARDQIAIRAGDSTTPAQVQPCVPSFAHQPLALDALYVLSSETTDQLTTGEAFAEFGACLFDEVSWPNDVRRGLRLLFHLVSTLPVRRISLGVATGDSLRDIRG
jgi:hypothetical protein